MRSGIRNLLGALAIAAALGAPAAAGPLEDANDAYREKAYAKAAELWRPLAEKGDAEAQYSLGTLYAEGKGVEQNDATAFLWFQRAANQGVAEISVGNDNNINHNALSLRTMAMNAILWLDPIQTLTYTSRRRKCPAKTR